MSSGSTTAKIPESVTGFDSTVDEIVLKLETDLNAGLSNSEVETRLSLHGKNVIVTPQPGIWKVYLAPLFDTLIVIYLVMTGIMVLFSFLVPSVRGQVLFWLTFIGFNMVIAIFQQYRAQKKVEELQKLSPAKTHVIRDGLKIEIPVEHLVVGDVIEVQLGDRIPADARLVETSNFTVDEASLTGESIAVRKERQLDAALPEDTSIAHRKNMIYLGSFVQTGTAKAVVVATGNRTELGKIAVEMSDMHTLEIPLRTRVNGIGRKLGTLMVLFLLLLIIYNILIQDPGSLGEYATIITRSIITAMAVMPINIPLLTTVVLITGVLHMAQKNVIIKELAVVETLGRTSVLCSDKTGTMTTSKMSVVKVWDGEVEYEVPVQGHKYIIRHREEPEDIRKVDFDSKFGFLVASGMINNDATLVEEEREDGEYKILGNATDIALMSLGLRSKLDIHAINKRITKVRNFPFDSAIKRMSTVYKDLDGSFHAFTKGASEVLIPLCTKIGWREKSEIFTKKKKDEMFSLINMYASEGYRIVSLAYRPLKMVPDTGDEEKDRTLVENELIYMGFMCILDPPRPGVKEAVENLDNAGIFPIMITGDSASTAATIARNVGILDDDEIVIEGKDIPNLSEEDFFKVSVFARVSPSDKKVIVDKYQGRGGVVGMTGDGVNDALAITLADAGIAMGITGTEVAKEAADIVISDDSYVSIVNGVAEGRNLYEKIRTMIFFYIALNIAEAIVYFSAALIPDFFILNDIQRAYIFIIVHAIPPLAIIFGKNDEGIMQLKPRKHDSLLPLPMVTAMIIFILTFAGSIGLIYVITYREILDFNSVNAIGFKEVIDGYDQSSRSTNHAKARTLMLTTVYLVETFIVHSIRRFNMSFKEQLREADRFIWMMVLLPLVLHLILMYSGLDLSGDLALYLVKLGPVDWMVAIVGAVIPLGSLELYKYISRKRQVQF